MTLTEKIAYIRGLADGLKLDESKDEVKVINAMMELLEDEVCEEFYGDDCDCCDCDDDCDCCDCDDDCDCDCVYYEVTCPKCEETICVDEDLLLEGEVICPECGEILEFDFSELEMDDDCCCGCCDEE